ncbi:Predicted DNA-binding transcriptional regulator YafY, contains an HTH and WYL domains [Pseudoxanthobacter soli DSM 19599]|uniref:Predicted DNA-binding transcriptional regulator YafY, contains an HTH and WYL domains n=1 Tax=Pseudoxanthobacter soli DSM 19599 TaxID=1123029 RepID=A0A1M7ZP82_9HYPH|nr:YafY family protein [Pseudoxanthobacter soli]SHO66629.1 Predicted DNA-binding transcriptional regulator YafY, contains an HTH and WYL domains [Pseudoxanthobacter soli DSM 19599]
MRRADRLFQIIQILRRSPKPVTGAALAAELEVSMRTVYRDIADLMAQRVPIVGEAGVGYVLHADFDMPALMLTPAELEAIVLGVQWVVERDDPALSSAARDVLAKVATVVPGHLRPFIADPSTAIEPPLDASQGVVAVAGLRDAIRGRRKLRLLYRAGNGERSERVVWPVVLGYSDTRRILIAWCERRQAFRHFRTDRMEAAEILAEPIGEPRSLLLRRWKAWRSTELAERADMRRP